MKRFQLFVWNQCYPYGGMNDFHSSYSSRPAAIRAADKLLMVGTLHGDCAQVYDLNKEEVTAYTDHDKKWVKEYI